MMRKILLSVVCFAYLASLHAQLSQNSVVTTSDGTIYFYQYKPPNYSTATGLLPLIVSLHGVGEAGDNPSELSNVLLDGLPLLLSQGNQLQFTWQGKTEGFVFLAPQASRSQVNDWPTYFVDDMIAYGIANLKVDPNRVFLTGYSAGGGGVWKYAASSTTAASKLAGLVPAASSSASGNFCDIASSQVALWAFHGGNDQVIPGQTDQAMTNSVNGCSPLIIPAVDTVIANESHGIFEDVTYEFDNSHHYPNVFQWMLKVNRTLDPNNDAVPVPVVAGNTVYNFGEPFKAKDFPILDGSGSYDPDDIIMDYLWYQTTGPTVSLPTNMFPTTTVADPNNNIGMAPGTYTFLLRVKDYLTSKINNKGNHTQFSTVTVNVTMPVSGHAAPATDAGGTITITDPVTTASSIGRAMAYGCPGNTNCFSSYNWVQVAGSAGGPVRATLNAYNNPGTPYSPGAGEVTITGITTPGVYEFQYSATNQYGETGSDILFVNKLSSALPVNYAYFNGVNNGNKNVLTWATTSEINSARFDIMRSTDGINFNTIGSLTSKGGAVLTAYSFDDNNIPPGLAYYRLSQVDKDGHSTLSQTISIVSTKTGLFVDKYPNPVHDNLTVNVQATATGPIQIIIADMQGRTMLQQKWQKDQSLLQKAINVTALQNGVYQMIVILGQDKQVSSFVKY